MTDNTPEPNPIDTPDMRIYMEAMRENRVVERAAENWLKYNLSFHGDLREITYTGNSFTIECANLTPTRKAIIEAEITRMKNFKY